MNVDQLLTRIFGFLGTALIATAVLGRSNAGNVINAFGNAVSQMMGAALGKGVEGLS